MLITFLCSRSSKLTNVFKSIGKIYLVEHLSELIVTHVLCVYFMSFQFYNLKRYIKRRKRKEKETQNKDFVSWSLLYCYLMLAVCLALQGWAYA